MDSVRQEISERHGNEASAMNVYKKQHAVMGIGFPPPELLQECCEAFDIATAHRMKYELENNSYLFQYGPAIGTMEFRETLASFLSEGYHSEVNKSDLVQTSGATNGLHLILSTLVDLGGVVFVDEYTYMIALDAIAQFSTLKIVSLPLEQDGPNMEVFEELIEQHRFEATAGKPFWGIYYTIPTFHNPTGIVFSAEKCQRLITLARKSDILIACDDVYNLLHYAQPEAAPPKRLFAYDIEGLGKIDGWRGNVISNGTFSKILSPGIRLGWMECPPRCVEAFRKSGVLQSGGAANNYTGGIVTTMIQLGLVQRQLKLYSRRYAERLQAMLETLEANLPKECSFFKPQGGYFVWVRFPDYVDCVKFNQFSMEKHRVAGVPGTRFSRTGGGRNFIRLTFAFHAPDFLRQSVGTFCVAAREYMSTVQE
ncbi:2-aminoadipate transaminase [Anopheles cruzii]|uniref:2-aminoadipate transaminase n=1 Tax=Anopheles cruzii TaxID=68878 RepID=UPI0022EC5664|nr:2-aminoadipate transaminase [Anopheles cruzii]